MQSVFISRARQSAHVPVGFTRAHILSASENLTELLTDM